MHRRRRNLVVQPEAASGNGRNEEIFAAVAAPATSPRRPFGGLFNTA